LRVDPDPLAQPLQNLLASGPAASGALKLFFSAQPPEKDEDAIEVRGDSPARKKSIHCHRFRGRGVQRKWRAFSFQFFHDLIVGGSLTTDSQKLSMPLTILRNPAKSMGFVM
jgi:hypothetical protein